MGADDQGSRYMVGHTSILDKLFSDLSHPADGDLSILLETNPDENNLLHVTNGSVWSPNCLTFCHTFQETVFS